MKKFLLLPAIAVMMISAAQAQVSISTARGMAIGSTVTVKGIVTNGSELGVIRYIQDPTAGIALYSSTLSSLTKGDSITVTGTLKNYNNLLEIDPVSSFTKHSSGNAMPAPIVLTPSQLGENEESELVQINNVTFNNGGATFAGNTSYTFTSGGQSGVIYVRTGHPLVGTIVPTGPVTLIGIASQFNAQYQILPRGTSDIISASGITITSQLTTSSITTTGFNVNWTTNVNGSTFVKYGKTRNLELGTISGAGNTTSHTVAVTGTPGSIYFVKAYSVNGTDTATSGIRAFATVSNSTGNIKVYFNKSVDNSLSTGTNAVQLLNLIDDTLIAYINRAKYSMDIAIYSFDNSNISNIATAINNAYNRGVKVRFIYEGGNANPGVTPLNAGINKLASPTTASYGIMHNKFVVIDANSANANDPLVWTGGTNWTDNQINTDPNNVIIIQDQSLARAYEIEFEEMWGDTGLAPNSTASKFGPFKTDNTPHEFIIGGKRVEQYFSPSDQVNAKIIETINTGNTSICVETMLITRSDIAYALTNKASSGVDVFVLVDEEANTSQWSVLQAGLEQGQLVDYTPSGIMHHKTLIVDPTNTSSDPLVLTGSHNWSNSADQRNDENTLIIHDATIANIYYQEFIPRYTGSGGLLSIENGAAANIMFSVYPNPSNGQFNISFTLDRSSELTVRILDLSGRTVLEKNVSGNTGSNEMTIGKAGLSAGIYMLQVQSGNSISNRKLVVH